MDELSSSACLNREPRQRSWAKLGIQGVSSDHTSTIPIRMIEVNPGGQRRTRARKPKVKTGCKTCKIRRVKCDETKPTCFRCRKFGAKCDGYNGMEPPTERESKSKVLLPRLPHIAHHSVNSLIYEPVSTSKFDNSEEYQYFLHFRRHVTIDLSGSVPEAIWKQVIPRAGESETALRNLILAVSAMDLARQSSSSSSSSPHSNFAVTKYGKGLRGIQELISSRPDRSALRISIIASMLIFAFENLQGETELATSHAKTALNFVRNHLMPKISYSLEKQTFSRVPGLEDEVVDLLVRWDSMFVTSEYLNDEQLLEVKFNEQDILMPREFRTIDEVRGYLRAWQSKGMPYFPCLRTAFLGLDAAPAPAGPPGYYEKLMETAQHWFKALAPLYARTSEQPTSHEFMVVALLKVTGLLSYFVIQRAYLGPRAHVEPECRELTVLARQLLQNPYYSRSFSFDTGLIEAMLSVCMLCPDREICEDALRILRLAKGRVEMMTSAELAAARCEMALQMRFPASSEMSLST